MTARGGVRSGGSWTGLKLELRCGFFFGGVDCRASVPAAHVVQGLTGNKGRNDCWNARLRVQQVEVGV